MPLDQFAHQNHPPLRRNIGETHQTRMRHPSLIHESSEVGVDRHRYPVVGRGAFQQRRVARVRPEFKRLDDVVSPAA